MTPVPYFLNKFDFTRLYHLPTCVGMFKTVSNQFFLNITTIKLGNNNNNLRLETNS